MSTPSTSRQADNDDARRLREVERRYFDYGLSGQQKFIRQNPDLSRDDVAKFFQENPVVRKYYGYKNKTHKAEHTLDAYFVGDRVHLDLMFLSKEHKIQMERPWVALAICCYSRLDLKCS